MSLASQQLTNNQRITYRQNYLCKYCMQKKGESKPIINQRITSHIIGCHSKQLKQLGIFENFKAKYERDYEIDDTATMNIQQKQSTEKYLKRKRQKLTQSLEGQMLQMYKESDGSDGEEYEKDIKKLIKTYEQDGYLPEKNSMTDQIKLENQTNLNYLNQISELKQTIKHLIKIQNLTDKNKQIKQTILQYIKSHPDQQQKQKQINNKQQNEQLCIEFSTLEIKKQIKLFRQKIIGKDILGEQQINEFINKSLNFLVNLIEEVYLYLFDEQKIILNNISNLSNNHNPLTLNTIIEESQIHKRQYEKIFKQYQIQYEIKQEINSTLNIESFEKPSIPINTNIFEKNILKSIAEVNQKFTNKKFDVIEIDYPWPIDFISEKGSNFLPYETAKMRDLYDMEINELQENGYLFMWTVAQKFIESIAFMLMKGYRIVDSIVWIKKGTQKLYKKRPGFHVRHSKEICLIGLKGSPPDGMQSFKASDIIYEVPGENSEKPIKIKEIIETMVPDGQYIELFGRRNNLREKWVTVGNQL